MIDSDGIREIWLSGKNGEGYFCLVDEVDYGLVSKYRWYINGANNNHTYYARTNIKDASGKWHQVSMHSLLMSTPSGMVVDHINRCGLDNRRSNLRICSPSQNSRNSISRSKSGYKGVYFDKKKKVYRAMLVLGSFKSAEEAAKEYDKISKMLFGEYVRPNFGNKNDI